MSGPPSTMPGGRVVGSQGAVAVPGELDPESRVSLTSEGQSEHHCRYGTLGTKGAVAAAGRP